MSATLPTSHVAGDSFTATLSGSDHPASNGWTAQLVLIGPTRQTLAASAAGTDWAVNAAAATTAAWIAGAYTATAIYTNTGSGQRQSVPVGRLQITPDPASGSTDARALMTSAEQALADLTAAWHDYQSSGNFRVGAYTIAGRSMQYRSVDELLRALNAARRDVTSERATKRVAAGLSPRQTYVTRM